MKYYLPSLIFLFTLFWGCTTSSETTVSDRTPVKEEFDEVFYHVFQRSFYDSNGDKHGDLKGLEEKLDYLQDLGITSILLLPLYDSDYYHNYFPNDFKEIDPRYGTKEDYLNLVEAIHNRGMKIYMDMEIQYVTENHPWFGDSYQNPESKYSDYVIYNGEDNTEPETIIFGLDSLEGYDGKKLAITTVNLKNEKVKNYMKNLFMHWVDPNQDGDFSDGVDGFRIDHMMDDLDWKGKLTGLFSNFWEPIFRACRDINPELKIIAEQANWNDNGSEYFSVADVDMTFAFGLREAILQMDKTRIMEKYDSTFMDLPQGKDKIIFLENHDTQRLASDVEANPGKLRLGAALNILLKGSPLIYYGQELGMTGKGGFEAFGRTDANDIPRREAFEWNETVESDGHALWYKDTGPWWDETNLKDNDKISVEEQVETSGSLLNYYRSLLRLREDSKALQTGELVFIESKKEDVLCFFRIQDDAQILVCLNFSDQFQNLKIEEERSKTSSMDFISGKEILMDEVGFSLAPWQAIVLDW